MHDESGRKIVRTAKLKFKKHKSKNIFGTSNPPSVNTMQPLTDKF